MGRERLRILGFGLALVTGGWLAGACSSTSLTGAAKPAAKKADAAKPKSGDLADPGKAAKNKADEGLGDASGGDNLGGAIDAGDGSDADGLSDEGIDAGGEPTRARLGGGAAVDQAGGQTGKIDSGEDVTTAAGPAGTIDAGGSATPGVTTPPTATLQVDDNTLGPGECWCAGGKRDSKPSFVVGSQAEAIDCARHIQAGHPKTDICNYNAGWGKCNCAQQAGWKITPHVASCACISNADINALKRAVKFVTVPKSP